MEDGNNVQVNTTVNDQAPAVEDQVVDTPVIEQVSQLLQPETTEPKEQPKEGTPEEPEATPEIKEEAKIGIIDDAMIQQFPTLKMYRGKSLLDLPKAYHNITLAYAENQKRLKQIEKEQAKIRLPNPKEIPDNVDKKEDFDKWLVDYTERIRQETLAEVPKPEINWISKVQEVLPKDVDAQKVIDEWDKFNSARLYDKMGNIRPEISAFYNSNPEILLDEIGKFYNLSSQAQKNSMTVEKEANNKAYKTITDSIKKANENKEDLKGAQFNAAKRTEMSTPEDDILALIYQKAMGG